MKATVTSDTNQEYCINNKAVVKDSYNEIGECNKALVCDNSFKAVSSNLVGSGCSITDLQALIDAAVNKALGDLLGTTGNIPTGVEDLVDDIVTSAVDTNQVIADVTGKVEDILQLIGDDTSGIEGGTIAGLLDKHREQLVAVNGTLNGEDGLVAEVTEYAEAFTTLNEQVNRAGAVYGVDVTAGNAIAGFTIIAADGSNTTTSSFIVKADEFMVARGIDENGEIIGTPAFAINGNNIGFNGQVSFSSLTNGAGQTIIDGGLIDTDTVIADSIVLGSKQVSRHYGNHNSDDDAEAWVMSNTLIAPAERTPREGDTYYNTVISDNKRCTNADGENSSWERMKGDRGSVSATLNIDVDNVKGDDYLESNSGLLDNAISSHTGLTSAVGDRVFWSNISDKALNPASGEAVLTTSGWLADVALTVHGDAIVKGTLSATDIKTGTLDAEYINLDADYMVVNGSKVSIGGLTSTTVSKLVGNKLSGKTSGTTTITLSVSHTFGSTTSINGVTKLLGRSGDTSDDSASWGLSATEGMYASHLFSSTSSGSLGSVDGVIGSIPATANTGTYSITMSTSVSGIWDARLNGVFSVTTSRR